MSNEPLVVLTTLASADEARAFVRALVDARLVACGTLLPGATSIYRWEGSITEEPEVVVLLKTDAARWDALAAAVQQRHPYHVPEPVAPAAGPAPRRGARGGGRARRGRRRPRGGRAGRAPCARRAWRAARRRRRGRSVELVTARVGAAAALYPGRRRGAAGIGRLALPQGLVGCGGGAPAARRRGGAG